MFCWLCGAVHHEQERKLGIAKTEFADEILRDIELSMDTHDLNEINARLLREQFWAIFDEDVES